MLVATRIFTQHCIPENLNHNQHIYDNLKPQELAHSQRFNLLPPVCDVLYGSQLPLYHALPFKWRKYIVPEHPLTCYQSARCHNAQGIYFCSHRCETKVKQQFFLFNSVGLLSVILGLLWMAQVLISTSNIVWILTLCFKSFITSFESLHCGCSWPRCTSVDSVRSK